MTSFGDKGGMMEFEVALTQDILKFIEIRGKTETVTHTWACYTTSKYKYENEYKYKSWLNEITNKGTSYPVMINNNRFQYFSRAFGEVSISYNTNRGIHTEIHLILLPPSKRYSIKQKIIVTNKTNMKTISLIIIAILLSVDNSIFAQDKLEIQGKNNTYIQENDSPGLYVVYNKNNIFTKSTPAYLYFEHIPPICVGNKNVLDQLVEEHFAPYFKRYNGCLSPRNRNTPHFRY